jgi:hypothetical protein
MFGDPNGGGRGQFQESPLRKQQTIIAWSEALEFKHPNVGR